MTAFPILLLAVAALIATFVALVSTIIKDGGR